MWHSRTIILSSAFGSFLGLILVALLGFVYLKFSGSDDNSNPIYNEHLASGQIENEQASSELIRETWEPLSPYIPTSRLRKASEPVGKIIISYKDSDRKGSCTGTIIAPFLILTSYHCLLPPSSEPSLEVSSLHIIFGFYNSEDRQQLYDGGRLRLFKLDTVFIDGAYGDDLPTDFAVFRTRDNIDPDTGEEIDPSQFWGKLDFSSCEIGHSQTKKDADECSGGAAQSQEESDSPVSDNTKSLGAHPLVVIHHPYREESKHISRYSCHTNGVRFGPDPTDERFSIGHSCATDKGSSGAPVLFQDSLKIAGIHRGGLPNSPRKRDIRGVMPNMNVFSSVHDMIKVSLDATVETTSGRFAKLVIDSLPSIKKNHPISSDLVFGPRSQSVHQRAVVRSIKEKSFSLPEGFSVERLGLIRKISQGKVSSCNGFYLGKGTMITSGHCLLDMNNDVWSSELAEFGMVGFRDLMTQYSSDEVSTSPWFEFFPSRSLLKASKPLDYAVIKLKSVSQVINHFKTSVDPRSFMDIKIRKDKPISGEQITLLYFGQSNNLVRNQCIVEESLSEAFMFRGNRDPSTLLAYRCTSKSLPGSSGGILVDSEARLVAIHMYVQHNRGEVQEEGYLGGGLALSAIREELLGIEGVDVSKDNES